jgi:hypothetical protein
VNDDEKFCSQCFSARELIETVSSRGTDTAECRICHSKNVPVLSAHDPLLKRIFRALIRVNYSEWSYNGHLGGEFLSSLLFAKNKIMNLDSSCSLEEFECAFGVIESAWYPETDEEIALGGGYWDGGILVGINSRLDNQLASLLGRGFEENYYQIQAEVSDLLSTVRTDIDSILPSGSRLFRARIGVRKRLTRKVKDFDADYYYVPYSAAEIESPPVHLAPEGRLNRARVSILYLASDRETAVAEVRPHPGHLVSSAEFISNKALKIADFTNKDVRNFLSDSRLEDLRRIFSFNALLNLPVPPDKCEYHLITQLLSDCVREAGFDGVKFQSSLGTGENVACFSRNNFSLRSGSEKVLEVKALTYCLEASKTLSQGYEKDYHADDSDDPFSTLFDVLERRK